MAAKRKRAIPLCPVCQRPASTTETKYGPRHECHGLRSWNYAPLVSPETHRARAFAHAAFDPLWKGPTRTMSRGKAYFLLAQELSMQPRDCHIAMMNEDDARRVPDAVKRIRKWIADDKGTRPAASPSEPGGVG